MLSDNMNNFTGEMQIMLHMYARLNYLLSFGRFSVAQKGNLVFGTIKLAIKEK